MKSKKKKLKKAEIIGMFVGFPIAGVILGMGRFGIIPAFIIAYCSYWIVKKIAQFFLKEEKENPEESTTDQNDKPKQ